MDVFQAMTVFVKVVESGSLTAAARQCEMSTTMVGNHLKALEQRLGVSLLQRTTRRQNLTEFGTQYYRRCLDVLALVNDSERMAEHIQTQPSGTLRITAPPAFGAERLSPMLKDFMDQYPQIKVEVVLSNQLMDLIEHGFDAAIRLGMPESSALIARPLRDYTLTICASRDYLERRGTPLKAAHLCEHNCLAFAYPAGDDWRATDKLWKLTGPEGVIEIPVAGSMIVNSSPALRQAALAGMGIAMLPDVLIREDLQAGKLIPLLQAYRPPSRPMWLMYAQDRYRLPKVRHFVDSVLATWGK
ncbi:LysR family transcriptional regulator [Pseudomonas putida]|jgi:DNA-binding transcriptional LysR family regulator|uniref:LysR family transcriptional regulator n=1 Tax=Pseudomonas putida TaxID=303 RepID=UPI0023635B68|nr:LysR family transcriptional regulator [Pseudomonas putida]MDD1966850.1 LysR family transcriptional regulator [Pseudomonas putida]